MRRKLLCILAIFLSVVIYSGCLENVSQKKTKSLSLKSLGLKLDDLPSGYIKQDENENYSSYLYNGTIYGKRPLEFYFVSFASLQVVAPAIALTMYRFNSSSDAELVMYNLSEQLASSLSDRLNIITPQDVQKIGDDSIYELFEGNMGEHYGYLNATWSFICFRIENITVSLLLEGLTEWNVNYVELTFNYAKIIENRIKTTYV